MTEEIKQKYIKKACLPIKIATITLGMIILSMFIFIAPMANLAKEMYAEYGIEDYIPGGLNIILEVINYFQENVILGIIILASIIGITIGINILWKIIAKTVINSTKLDEETLKKRVNLFTIIISAILVLSLIASFGIIFFIVLKAMMEIYMGSFLFEAYGM